MKDSAPKSELAHAATLESALSDAKTGFETTDAKLPPASPEQSKTPMPPPKTGDAQEPVKTSSIENVQEEPSHSAAEPIRASAPSDAEKFFAMQKRFPLQVFEHESRGQKLSHWGPTLTSIASLVLTLFVWNNTKQLSKEQLVLQERQTKVQENQAKAELSDIRFKFLNDLTASDEDKRVPAEIGLAGHGLDALPVVDFALGVEQEHIRQSAVNVFYRMFLAAPDFPERDLLLTKFMERMMSPNKNLRIGIVQSLVKVGPLLNVAERQKVIAFLESKVPPQTICRDGEGRKMVKWAATFFSASDSTSIPYLVSIARNPECGDGWAQAMVKLGDVAVQQPQRRGELLKTLEQTKNEALNNLEGRLSDEDLTEGFGGFLKGRKFVVTFEDVREKVEQEFDRLLKMLSGQ